MAVAVQSSSTTAWASASTVALTKPTGLAVGDLMIVHIGVDIGTVTTLSGWTLIGSKTLTADTLKSYAFYKVADSTDTASSTFTFSLSGTVKVAGGIYRIDGQSYGTPVYTSASDDDTNATSPTFTNTVTPLVASSMLVMLGVVQQADSTSAISGYAVTTSSPSFTEVYDFNNSNGVGATHLLCGAYGIRPETTATGNSTFTISVATNPDSVSQILVIPPSKDFTASDTTTVTDSRNYGTTILKLDVLALTDTITTTVTRILTNLAKSVVSWINQDKN